ncbi:hypothetical protein M8997_014110, partial [Phyllobacterium sp. 21LDTY02-6]|nr:hypothetical protein [Phyllobacterium sp. 21LDTY02-6]
MGFEANATVKGAVAIGRQANAWNEAATAIGWNAKATGQYSSAIGKDAQAIGGGAVALGWEAKADGVGAVALGGRAQTDGVSAVALGWEAKAKAYASQALGFQATASGVSAIAIGWDAKATGEGANAIGVDAQADGVSAVALGRDANAKATVSQAIGYKATAERDAAIAIGWNAKAANAYSVALGSNATTEAAISPPATFPLNGKDYTLSNPAPVGVVSIGRTYSETNRSNEKGEVVKIISPAETRQIVNLAPGRVKAGSTDAVNGDQLHAAYEGINDLGRTSVQYTPTDTNNDGKIDETDKHGAKLVLKDTVISKVAAGKADTDAVNMKQLDAVDTKASEANGKLVDLSGATVQATI